MYHVYLYILTSADDEPGLDELLCMSYTGEDGRDVLVDQLKPHWRRLAIALKFPRHQIDTIKHEDDPVLYFIQFPVIRPDGKYL